jgi:hypothetical protein
MFSSKGVDIAPYTVIESDAEQKMEVRVYDPLILASTSMSGDDRNGAFRRLFKYIAGANEGAAEIPMTAPVFMDEDQDEKKGTEIPMTAPVFMDKDSATAMMSFVMPKDFTMETTPKPTSPDVTISELKNYTVAVIQFSGTLRDKNVAKHKAILESWIETQGYDVIGAYQKAGYNPPFTLPLFRRNEVLIPIKRPKD